MKINKKAPQRWGVFFVHILKNGIQFASWLKQAHANS
jgi:hypothetical protein